MAKSILDIIIRTAKEGQADKQTVAGLTAIKTGLAQAGVMAAAFVAAYYTVDKVLDATIGTHVRLAAQVRETSRLTGTSAEDTSRLIQMADDLTISYESLQKSLWFASKNGFDVNIESLAALADQYVALQSPSEKAKLLADNFGKGGAEMGKMLEQGGDGIRSMSSAIQGSLILTEEATVKAREYEIAVDALEDSFEGVKVAMGENIIGPTTTLLNKMNAEIKEGGGNLFQAEWAWRALLGPIGAVWNLLDLFGNETNDVSAATDGATTSYQAAARAAEEYAGAIDTIDYSNLLDMTLNIQDGLAGFAEKAAEIHAQIAELDPASEDYAATLSDLEGELRSNAAAQELWAKKLVFSLMQARLAAGGINEGEFSFLIELGVQMGLVDQKSATMAQNLNANLDSIDLSKPAELADAWKKILDMPDSTTFTVYFDSDITGYMDPTCFVGETPISTPRGFTVIEQVNVGDIISMKTADGVIAVSVLNKKESTRSDLVTVSASDGQSFTCSPNHRWQLESGEWRMAEHLQSGDALLGDHGEVRVMGVYEKHGEYLVYNLTVDHPDHTYMVGGLVVHNYKAEASMPNRAVDNLLDNVRPGVNSPSSSSSSLDKRGGGTVINVYNPTFNVISGGGIVDVLEALS